MIRRNLSGHLPVVHETAFVDPTAIPCGRIIVERNVLIGPYSVVEGVNVPPGFYIPSTANIHSDEELTGITRVTPDVSGFSKSVAQTNNALVKGYKRIRNEF